MTVYANVVADFAERTRKNLEIIDHIKDKGEYEVYEITQLINSMLGLLVFPQQEFVNRIPNTPLSDLEKQGWPHIRTEPSYQGCRTLKELVRKMRNSITHFHVEFLDESGEITGLRLWDETSHGRRNWEVNLSLEDLRSIATCFIDVLKDENLIRGQ